MPFRKDTATPKTNKGRNTTKLACIGGFYRNGLKWNYDLFHLDELGALQGQFHIKVVGIHIENYPTVVLIV